MPFLRGFPYTPKGSKDTYVMIVLPPQYLTLQEFCLSLYHSTLHGLNIRKVSDDHAFYTSRYAVEGTIQFGYHATGDRTVGL